MSRIKKVTQPDAWETLQARIDESIITKQPMRERPFWYEDQVTGLLYHDIYGCIGWPTQVTDTSMGMAGYLGVVAVLRSETLKPEDSHFQLLDEFESFDVPTLLETIVRFRVEYGFGLHPGLMQAWFGNPEIFITLLALKNERLIAAGGERAAILIIPPDDFYVQHTFDHYVRSLRSVVTQGRKRLYFRGNDILKNKLPEFKRDDPAVFAVGGLVHSLLSRTMWMDQARENAFVVEEERAA